MPRSTFHRITVKLPTGKPRSYKIDIRPGLLGMVPRMLEGFVTRDGLFLVTDAVVARLMGRKLHAALSGRYPDTFMLDVPPGEPSKSLNRYSALSGQLLSLGIRRGSLLLSLGGGVVGDLTGFVAATVLRGVQHVQIPTTLLAQLDSSVGGKVGIDHPLGKNMIGAFHQPSAVFIDPEVLRTLPLSEFRNGLAELVKVALALDGELFRAIERASGRLRPTETSMMSDFIARAVSLKSAVVMKDEFEHGLRKTLNLGHTIGHAVEAAAGYRIKHGEAVAIGVAVESAIACSIGLMSGKDLVRVRRLLKTMRLPTSVPSGLSMPRFFRALALDKKASSGSTAFVLPDGIGTSAIGVDVSHDIIRHALGRPV